MMKKATRKPLTASAAQRELRAIDALYEEYSQITYEQRDRLRDEIIARMVMPAPEADPAPAQNKNLPGSQAVGNKRNKKIAS